LACLAGPDELVLALVALDERGVDRRREGRIVELERDFGTRFAGCAGPACSELDTPCGDAEVWGAVVVAVAGLDGGLDVEGEGLEPPARKRKRRKAGGRLFGGEKGKVPRPPPTDPIGTVISQRLAG